MKKRKTVQCLKCARDFQQLRASNVYCSSKCRISYTYDCVCSTCKAKFIATSPATKYCSQYCKVSAYPKANCGVCNKLFGKRNGIQRFCSPECREQEYDVKNYRTRFLILRRDGFRCHYCGDSPHLDKDCQLQIDHMKPKRKGGNNLVENLITSCQKCNIGKYDWFDTTKEINDLIPVVGIGVTESISPTPVD